MKNKAFTLVELLGVIVLLGILGIVIIPKIGDSIENSKATALVTQEEQIKKAANDFLVDNTDFLEENDTITIKLGVLKQKGYLPVNIKNPKTKKNISNESLITVTKVGNTYKIDLVLIDLENVTENIDNNSPILVLNGDYVEYVEVNDIYQEKGAIAKTSTGETISNVSTQIKLNNVEQTSINTSQLQTYNVIYSATDQSGKTISATRTVIIRDTKSPLITFPTETVLHVSEVAGFNALEGVTVTDNYTITPTITANSSLAGIAGKYVITYTATDSSNNETIEKRVIKVEDEFDKYYANLEYIESTGTQYIDTGYYLSSNNINLKTKVYMQTITNSETNILSNQDNKTGRFVLGLYNKQVFGYSKNGNTADDNVVSSTLYGSNTLDIEADYNYSTHQKTLTVNGNTTTSSYNKSISNSNRTIKLFSNGNGNALYFSGRIYYVKITVDGVLIKDFIPCYRKSDGEAGLYDLVNNKFYKSEGTEKFIKPESFSETYQKLDYIGSTGTQYINTGYVLNSNNINIKTKLYTPDMPTDEQDILSNKDNETGRFVLGIHDKQVFGYSRNDSNKDDNVSSSTYEGANTLNIEADYNYSTHLKTLTVNGNTTTSSYNNAISNTNKSIKVFPRLDENSPYFIGRLHSMQITVDGVLIRDFVPCYRKTDGVAGLYDLVNDVFYENAGTGEFTKGNPIN